MVAVSGKFGRTRIWDLATGTLTALIPLPEHGYATLCPSGYKLDEIRPAGCEVAR
jgi:hypothetical protein